MRKTIVQTFAWPALLAAITLASLVLGLVGSGVLDGVAVVGLAVPVAMGTSKAMRGRRPTA